MFGAGEGGQAGRVGAAVGAPLLALYLITASRTVQGGDTGEFVLLGLSGGVAHPPGYPLYVLLSRLFALLPFEPPPFRAALLSALAGAGTAVVLALLVRRLTREPLAAVVAGLAFGLAPVTWKLAGVPEVFTLNALLVALVAWVVVRLRDLLEAGIATPRAARVHIGAAALLAGLGLANHHTVALAAPLGVWAVALVARHLGGRAALPAVATGAVGLLLGLLPYLYLPIAARGAPPADWIWGDPGTAAGLVRHLLRQEYGTFSLGLNQTAARPLANLAAFWGALPRALLVLYFAAGIWGLLEAARRQRGLALALGGSLLLAGGLFLAVFNLPADALAASVAERFHLLPLLLFCVFVGLGVAAARRFLTFKLSPVVLVAPLPFMVLQGIAHADWRGEATVERYLRTALHHVAPRAVILGVGDAELFGFALLLGPYRIRPDVRYLDVHLLRKPWYHRRARALTPEFRHHPFDPERTAVVALAATLADQVPTYLTPQLAGLVRRIPVYPEGLLLRVRPTGQPIPAPERLEPSLERALGDLQPLPAESRDPWARDLRNRSAELWAMLARAYQIAGRPQDATRCHQRATLLLGDP